MTKIRLFSFATPVAFLFLILDEAGVPLWESILGASAMVTAVFGFADQIRWTLERILGLFLVQARLQDPLASHLANYLQETTARRRPSTPEYSAGWFWVRPLARTGRVVAEILNHADRSHYWVKVTGKKLRRPLWLTPRRDDDDDLLGATLVRYPRGFDIEILLKAAASWRDEQKAGRHRVITHYGSVGDVGGGNKTAAESPSGDDSPPDSWRLLNYNPEDIGPPGHSAADHLALAPESKSLIEDARRWLGMRAWYQERSVAHRRGYLVIGPPGVGKTTIVRETAAQLELPVHVVDLATHTNQDLQKTWHRIASDVPCVILVEDVDGVFNIRTPAPGVKLTFDALLNSLDGVSRRDGVAFFMTTNHPEKLDPALVRPGRVDVRVKVGPLDLVRRLELAKKFLGDDDTEGVQLAHATGDVPAAEFVERCLAVAQRRQWGEDAQIFTEGAAMPIHHDTPVAVVVDEDDDDD